MNTEEFDNVVMVAKCRLAFLTRIGLVTQNPRNLKGYETAIEQYHRYLLLSTCMSLLGNQFCVYVNYANHVKFRQSTERKNVGTRHTLI